MRHSSMKVLLILAGLFIFALAMNANASMQGVVVTIGDTCWYSEGTMELPVDIHWATWSEYPDCGMRYWFPYFADPYPCDRENKILPDCWPQPDCFWTCPTEGWYIDTCGVRRKCTKAMSCELIPNPDQCMCAFQLVVSFCPYTLEAWGVVNGSLISDWGTVQYVIDNDKGIVSIGGVSSICKQLPPLTDPTELVKIAFKVRPWAEAGWNAHIDVDYFRYNATEWPYVYYNNEWYEPYAGHPCSLYTDARTIGDFLVCEYECVSGWVKYCGNQKPICDAEARLEYIPSYEGYDPPDILDKMELTQCGPGCQLDCRGKFVICDILDQYDYQLCIWREFKPEDAIAISPLDASLIMRHLVAQQELSYCGYTAADVDTDCDVTPLDACLIMKWLVGEFPFFPKMADQLTNWYFFQAFGWDDECGGCDFTLYEGWGACPPQCYGYYPLVERMFMQNFWGVVLGDVSGNWGFPSPKISTGVLADVVSVSEDVVSGRTVYTISANTPDVYACKFTVEGDAQVTVNNEGWLHESRTTGNTTIVAAAGSEPSMDGVLATISTVAGARVVLSDVTVNETPLSGEMTLGKSSVPEGYSLSGNYPNPFNPTTNIGFSLPKTTEVTLTIYNVLGQTVTTLVDGVMEAGDHQVVWNGTDAAGNQVSSGVYLYRLETSDFSATKKMTLLK